MRCKFDGDLSADNILRVFGLQDGGPVQTAIDMATIRYMVPYWAYDTGTLANCAFTDSDIGSGNIVYGVDYANEMYYGVRADGTPVNYHTDKNPQAGPYPFDRMMADHANDIYEEAVEVARSQ